MMVYVGQTRSSTLIPRLEALGFGEMVARGEYPPRRKPWAYDNGAFGDWRAQRPFNADAFTRDIERIAGAENKPDFLVVPDLVAQGSKSLEFSYAWLPVVQGVAPCFLAVQDGMTGLEVEEAIREFDGLFVGGTLGWKVKTGQQWVRAASRIGKPCHIGRVGTFNRVRWAQRIGATSIDSCLPLWSEENLQRFLGALAEDHQLSMEIKTMPQPQQIDKYEHEYKAQAWEQYTLAELGQWVHLFAKRAEHRSTLEKRQEDLEHAANYHAMMGAKLESLRNA